MSSANLTSLVLTRRGVPLFTFVYNTYIYMFIYIYIYLYIDMVTVKGCTIPQTLQRAEISAEIVIFFVFQYGSI